MFEHAVLIPYYEGKFEMARVAGYFVIETTEYPEMYPEFASGPPEGEEAFWNTAVHVHYITKGFVVHKRNINYEFMKAHYGGINGRNDRIHFWKVMKHLEKMDKDVDDNLPDGSCVEAMI